MEAEHLEDRIHELTFGVRRSIRYHDRRRAWFDKWHVFTTALSIVFGSTTIFSILKDFQSLALTAGAAVTIFSTIDLVIGNAQKARLHHDLAKRFIELERRIVLAGEMCEEQFRNFFSERLTIEADEPPVLHVLNVICHNELTRALGLGNEHIVVLTRRQRWLANIGDFGFEVPESQAS